MKIIRKGNTIEMLEYYEGGYAIQIRDMKNKHLICILDFKNYVKACKVFESLKINLEALRINEL